MWHRIEMLGKAEPESHASRDWYHNGKLLLVEEL